MSIGAAIAIASIWAGTSFAVFTFRKDLSPVGLIVCLIVATVATGYVVGIKS